MEEAGFFNCVSVPDGAPETVSSKEIPSESKVGFILYISFFPISLLFDFLSILLFCQTRTRRLSTYGIAMTILKRYAIT